MQWERKIEQAERGGRFDREGDAPSQHTADEPSGSSARADEPTARGARSDAPESRSARAEAQPARAHRFERAASAPRVEAAAALAPVTGGAAVAERRTITITGQPTPARRRPTLAERHIAAQPDRIALWAFLLGLLLIAVAAGTAHA